MEYVRIIYTFFFKYLISFTLHFLFIITHHEYKIIIRRKYFDRSIWKSIWMSKNKPP